MRENQKGSKFGILALTAGIISAVIICGGGVLFSLKSKKIENVEIAAVSGATAPKDTTKYWGDAGTGYDLDWDGSGTENDPWLISSAGELAGLAYSTYYGVKSEYANGAGWFNNRYFKQTRDIDVSSYWWQPIGTQYNRSGKLVDRWFGGNYEGGGHTVSGVFTKSGTSNANKYSGLFGHLESASGTARASIKNLAVIDSNIQGENTLGAIVGLACNANIINCYSNATITSNGFNNGGIVGCAYDKITISNCYYTGVLSGHGETGGIVGAFLRNSLIVNCFSLGTVTGSNNVGQVIGLLESTATASRCFCAQGTVIGSGSGEAWAISGLASQAKVDTFYTYASNWNSSYPWDFTKHWKVVSTENDGYPVLRAEDWSWHTDTAWQGDGLSEATAFQIDSPEKLAGLAAQVNAGNNYSGKYFKQTADISLGGYEWTPIGFSYEGINIAENKNFSGVYDGNNYVIKGLNIGNNNGHNGTGLFASINDAIIKNVFIKNATLGNKENPKKGIGTLVGYIYGNTSIDNCHISNAIVYGDYLVGGIIGRAWVGPTVKNCSFSGYVEGHDEIAGIAGYFRGSLLENCHNSGTVRGAWRIIGGIAGYVDGGYGRVTIRNCVSDGIIEGPSVVGSIVGWLVYGATVENCAGYGTIRYFAQKTEAADIPVTEEGPFAGGVVGHVLETTNSDKETYINIISNCSFIGECNTRIDPFFDSSSTGYRASNNYAVINGKGYYSDGDFADWTVIPSINNGFPMQKVLYAVAQFGDEIEAIWFENKGFKKV